MDKIITRDEARAQGLKRFFTGKPCKHGHVDERLVSSGACMECDRIRCRTRYTNDTAYRETMRKHAKEKYATDPEFREAAKNRYANNPARREAAKAYNRERYANNPEWREAHRKECQRNSRERNARRKDRGACTQCGDDLAPTSTNFCPTHLEAHNLRCQNRNATKHRAIPLRYYSGSTDVERHTNHQLAQRLISKGSHGAAWSLTCPDYQDRMAAIMSDVKSCEDLCGVPFDFEHYIPLALGGEHSPENCYPLNRELHRTKSTRIPGVDWDYPANKYEQVSYITRRESK